MGEVFDWDFYLGEHILYLEVQHKDNCNIGQICGNADFVVRLISMRLKSPATIGNQSLGLFPHTGS